MEIVKIQAPAKLNLALDILGTTPQGYHTLDMIMQTISLFDTITLEKSDHYSLCVSNSAIPTDARNTATKAAQLFFAHTGIQSLVQISIQKQIPEQAGMAGGSADAAAVLIGLNALYNTNLSIQTLCALGAQIGADVPFSILGGTARVTGIGEILTPLVTIPPCWFAVAMPSVGNSTPTAYANYDKLGTPIRPNVSAMQTAIEQQNLIGITQNMQNALEFSNSTPQTARIHAILQQQNALASMMTGSGAAVFGVFKTKNQAETAAKALTQVTPTTFTVCPTRSGPTIIK